MMYAHRSFAALATTAWLALSQLASADELEKCANMLRFTGAPAPGRDSELEIPLCRAGYVLSYNTEHHEPSWVLEVLTTDHLKRNVDRKVGTFRADKDVGDMSARLEDYKGSGYDRGHMAPAGDMVWDETAMKESFLLTNMAPQIGFGFNRDIWKHLEEYARDLVRSRSTLVVITGPVVAKATSFIRLGKTEKREPQSSSDTGVTIPTAFYKIIYDPTEQRAIAFLLPHRELTGHKFEEFIETIREIEDQTDIDFLRALSEHDQNRIETIKSLRWHVFDGG